MPNAAADSDATTLVGPHATDGPVFIARGLSKVYGAGSAQVVALSNVDLSICQG